MPTCTACATISPNSASTSRSAMSMPADTPAPVTTLPSNTTRSVDTSTSRTERSSRAAQCVVAFDTSPASASNVDPVHTEVVHFVVGCTSRSHSTTPPESFSTSRQCPDPGTTTMSVDFSEAKVSVGTTTSPPSHLTGSSVAATNRVETIGTEPSTSYGPTKSSAVMFG